MTTKSIKNKNSVVTPEKSIQAIEKLLIEAGATHISKTIENGVVTGLLFQISFESTPFVFKLPAKVDKVFERLYRLVKRRNETARQNTYQQAQRTAWKSLHEWVHLQLDMIEEKQLEPMEAFFPYLYNLQSSKTLYEKSKRDKFKLLEQMP